MKRNINGNAKPGAQKSTKKSSMARFYLLGSSVALGILFSISLTFADKGNVTMSCDYSNPNGCYDQIVGMGEYAAGGGGGNYGGYGGYGGYGNGYSSYHHRRSHHSGYGYGSGYGGGYGGYGGGYGNGYSSYHHRRSHHSGYGYGSGYGGGYGGYGGGYGVGLSNYDFDAMDALSPNRVLHERSSGKIESSRKLKHPDGSRKGHHDKDEDDADHGSDKAD